MLITYFDEVKPSGDDQPYYWLGGLMMDEIAIPAIERELGALAVRVFGTSAAPDKDTEFHATDIASGRRAFKKWRNPAERFNVLKELVRIYDKPQGRTRSRLLFGAR